MGKINKFELRKKKKFRFSCLFDYWNVILKTFWRFGEESSCICMPIAYIEINCTGHARHVNWHAVKRDFDQTLHAIVWKKAQTKCLITPSFIRALTEGKQTKDSRCWVGGVGVCQFSHLSENPLQESRPKKSMRKYFTVNPNTF